MLNGAYREMAAHYSAAVLPGRVKAPKDKASVENTVGHVATWIIAGLRQRQSTSLPELKAAITERVAAYNAEPFQKRPGSRESVFAAEEQPLLTGLPAVPYEISTWVYGRRVGRNGRVIWQRNHYSVPFAHIGTKVDLRITDRVLQVYRGTERVSSHLLLPEGAANDYRTIDADQPTGQRYQPWDPPRVRGWAGRIGPSAEGVINRIRVRRCRRAGPGRRVGRAAPVPPILGRSSRRGLPVGFGFPGAVPALCASAADPGHRPRPGRRVEAAEG